MKLMLQPRKQQWISILQMTEKMHLLSDDENWDAITDLELSRKKKLESFFSTPILDDETDEISKGLSQILKSDHLLADKMKQLQQKISKSVKEISSNRQAIKAYAHIQA